MLASICFIEYEIPQQKKFLKNFKKTQTKFVFTASYRCKAKR